MFSKKSLVTSPCITVAYATFSFCTVLHNYRLQADSTFEDQISFQIEILPKTSTQKRKRTDLNQPINQARKRLLLPTFISL